MAEEIPRYAWAIIVAVFIIIVGGYVIHQFQQATQNQPTPTVTITTTKTVTNPVTTTVTSTMINTETITTTETKTLTQTKTKTVTKTVTETETETVMKSFWAKSTGVDEADLSVTGGMVPSAFSFSTITNYGYAEIEWVANGTVQFSFDFQTPDNQTFSFVIEPAQYGRSIFPIMPTTEYGFGTYITNLEDYPVHVEYTLTLHYIYPSPEET